MDIRRLLCRQHANLRAMLEEVRHSPRGRREIVFEMLTDAVLHHWAVEERHLYPLLAARGYHDVHHSIELHRALCHVLHELRGLCDDGPHFVSALKVLAAHVEQHIVDEEQRVLPFVARSVDEGEAHAIGVRMQETLAELENEDWLGAPGAWRNASA